MHVSLSHPSPSIAKGQPLSGSKTQLPQESCWSMMGVGRLPQKVSRSAHLETAGGLVIYNLPDLSITCWLYLIKKGKTYGWSSLIAGLWKLRVTVRDFIRGPVTGKIS